MLELCIMHELQ